MKQVLINKVFAGLSAVLLITGCKKENHPEPPGKPNIKTVVVSTAGDSAYIVPKLNEFRRLAGDPLNTAPGATSGRREVNWDAVPPAFTNANNFPPDFFGSFDPALAAGRKRGLILTSTGTSFRVDSTDFSEVDASYASQFEAFSRKRLFAYMGNTVTEVTFKVPGTNTPAYVNSFGVIFSDVDNDNSTSIEYFNGDNSLGTYKAAASPQGFSFLGVNFPDVKVTKIKITSGNGLLAAGVKDVSNGGTKDLVVMDDFIYSEPK